MTHLFNRYEKVTYEHLKPVCEKNGATVFAKVRLKDALPVEQSGINSDDYRFCLQAHLDFLVVDGASKTLFGVEYDGAGHREAVQQARDRRKDGLCERFGLSLLRINSNYLHRKFRDLDLLTYFVEVWFMHTAFYEAQARGEVPLEEDFDPWLVISDPGRKKRFPYWLSAEAQIAFQGLAKAQRVVDWVPSYYVGENGDGNYRCLAWIEVVPGQFAVVATGMRAQQFPVVLADLLSQIAVCDLHEKVKVILAGKLTPVAEGVFRARLASYEARFAMRARAGVSRGAPAPSSS
jgi:hypothetical protein